MELFKFDEEDEIVDVLADDVSLDSQMFQRDRNDGNYILQVDYNEGVSNSYCVDSYKPLGGNKFENVFDFNSQQIKDSFSGHPKTWPAEYSKNNYNLVENITANQISPTTNFTKEFTKDEMVSSSYKAQQSTNHFESALTREMSLHVEEMEKKNVNLGKELERLREVFSSQTKTFQNNENNLKEALRKKNYEIGNLKGKLEELINFCKNEKSIINEYGRKVHETETRNQLLEETLRNQKLSTENKMSDFEEKLKNEKLKTKEFFEKNQLVASQEVMISQLKNEIEILQEKNNYVVGKIEESMEKYEKLKTEKTELDDRQRKLLMEKKEKENSLKNKIDVFQEQYNETIEENESLRGLLRSKCTEIEHLQMKLDTLLNAEKKLVDSIDEVKFKENVSKEECTKLRVQVNSLQNEGIQKDNDLSQLRIERDQLRRQNANLSSENESLKNILNVFESKSTKTDSEKKELTEKANTSVVVIQSLKKELSKLSRDFKAVKTAHEESENKIAKMKEMQLWRDYEILDLEALVEVANNGQQRFRTFDSFSENLSIGCGTMVDSKDYSKMSKESLIIALKSFETMKERDEYRIKHLLSILSCLRNPSQMSFNGEVHAEMTSMKSPVWNEVEEGRRWKVLRRLGDLEASHKNMLHSISIYFCKITRYNNYGGRSNRHVKWRVINKREEFLKEELDRLENELMICKKNEMRLKLLVDGMQKNTPQLEGDGSILFQRYSSLLDLDARHRSLSREVNELLLLKEVFQNEISCHHAVKNKNVAEKESDVYSMNSFEENLGKKLFEKGLEFEAMDLELNHTSREKLQKELEEVRRQKVIHRLQVKLSHHEMLEKSLKEQLELSDDREKMLARRVVDLDEEVTRLKESMREAEIKDIKMINELESCSGQLKKSCMQVTQAFDEVNDKTLEIARHRNENEKLVEKIRLLKEEITIFKTIESKKDEEIRKFNIQEKKIENILKEKNSLIEQQKKECDSQNCINSQLKDEFETCSNKIGLLEKELNDSKNENKNYVEKIQKLNKEIATLQFEMNEHAITYEKKLKNKENDLGEAKRISLSLRKDLLREEKQLENYSASLRDLKKVNTTLRASLDSQGIRLEGSRHKEERLEQMITELKSEFQKQEVSLLTLDGKSKAFEAEKNRLTKEVLSLDEKCKRLMEDLEEANAASSKLMQERTELSALNSSLSANVEAMKKRWESTAKELKEENKLLAESRSREENRVLQLESKIQKDEVRKLENLNFNTKATQKEMILTNFIDQIKKGEIMQIVSNHSDFKKAKNLLSVKYPSLYQKFFADFHYLLNGNKDLETVLGGTDANECDINFKKQEKTNLDSLSENDFYFDSIFPDVKSNPLYGRPSEDKDHFGIKRVDEEADDEEDDEEKYEKKEYQKNDIKIEENNEKSVYSSNKLPLAFNPSAYNISLNSNKHYQYDNKTFQTTKKAKRAAYKEERTTYVRTMPLSAPSAPCFKARRMESVDSVEEEKEKNAETRLDSKLNTNISEMNSRSLLKWPAKQRGASKGAWKMMKFQETDGQRENKDVKEQGDKSTNTSKQTSAQLTTTNNNITAPSVERKNEEEKERESGNDDDADLFGSNLVQRRIDMFENKSLI